MQGAQHVSRTGNALYRRLRREILLESDICWLCGKPGADSADHVVPYSAGGSDTKANLRPAHLECNRRRGKRDATQINILRTSTEW